MKALLLTTRLVLVVVTLFYTPRLASSQLSSDGFHMLDGSDVWDTYHKTDDILAELRAMAVAAPGRVRYTEASACRRPDPAPPSALWRSLRRPPLNSSPSFLF